MWFQNAHLTTFLLFVQPRLLSLGDTALSTPHPLIMVIGFYLLVRLKAQVRILKYAKNIKIAISWLLTFYIGPFPCMCISPGLLIRFPHIDLISLICSFSCSTSTSSLLLLLDSYTDYLASPSYDFTLELLYYVDSSLLLCICDGFVVLYAD